MRTAVAGLAAALALLALFDPGRGSHTTSSDPWLELGPGPATTGFARATEPRPFHLPLDHGPHYDFQTEWWYYTGNVADASGRPFGFQVTFFRRGLTPGPPPAGPGLATNQVYFAHLAVTDAAGGRHTAVERFSRGAAGLAGASGRPFAVWVEDWRADALDPEGSAVHLRARDAGSGLLLDLELDARKPLVAHGDEGLSTKGGGPGNASYYVGYTRMEARGRLGATGRESEVGGSAWFDHEWSTSALAPGAVGWDWFSLQLDDGRDLMAFEIRRAGGGVEPASGGSLVSPTGDTLRLRHEDLHVEALAWWTSPATGVRYPARWRLRLPRQGIDLVVEPLVADQEMRTSFLYWEGAVTVSGRAGDRPVTGRGYVELTGYGQSMAGVF
jgi:predicted secreted hydrolase